MTSTILLVDDETNVLAGLMRVLCDEPYDFLTAYSGAEALELLDAHSIDAVISDQNMPGMTGVELLSQTAQRHPDTVRFMLTGKATLEVAMKAINDGAITRFFVKPCCEEELIVSLRQALQQRDLMREARKLLFLTKRQATLLEIVERNHPGITHLERDEDGAIVIDDVPTELDELIAECRKLSGEEGPARIL